MERSYHHGNLRQVLIDSALGVLADKGVDGFSLRETARRAEVSPAAYKHHFADTRRVMTALAEIAFARLADALEAADATAGQDLRARLEAQGTAYVGFALKERALFDLMWRVPLLDPTDPKLAAESARAFDCLDRLIRGPDAPSLPNTDPSMAPTIAAWSLVHGFSRLLLDQGLGAEVDAGSAATLLSAMLGRLMVLD